VTLDPVAGGNNDPDGSSDDRSPPFPALHSAEDDARLRETFAAAILSIAQRNGAE
jgi:hypothetical protein